MRTICVVVDQKKQMPEAVESNGTICPDLLTAFDQSTQIKHTSLLRLNSSMATTSRVLPGGVGVAGNSDLDGLGV